MTNSTLRSYDSLLPSKLYPTCGFIRARLAQFWVERGKRTRTQLGALSKADNHCFFHDVLVCITSAFNLRRPRAHSSASWTCTAPSCRSSWPSRRICLRRRGAFEHCWALRLDRLPYFVFQAKGTSPLWTANSSQVDMIRCASGSHPTT
jgi:hypothetical protein